MKIEEDSLRVCRHQVDKNAEILNKMVDQIVAKYSGALDKEVEKLTNVLKDSKKLSADEVEMYVLLIPAYLYFAVDGLETLGMDSDSAKTIRMEAYNNAILALDGTVRDKESNAELRSAKEQFVEMIFARAYKKLRSKTEVALQLCMSARKVLERRVQEVNIDRMDGSIKAKRGDSSE
jgi:hypothetical protein